MEDLENDDNSVFPLTIKSLFSDLIDLMVETMPIEKINTNPFDFYQNKLKNLQITLQETIEEFSGIKKSLGKKVKEKKDFIDKLKTEIGEEFLDLENENFLNYNGLILFLENKENELILVKEKLIKENQKLLKEIEELEEILKVPVKTVFCSSSPLLKFNLFLKEKKEKLKSEFSHKEELREYFYEEIEKLTKILGVCYKFTHEESINALEKATREFSQRVEKNKQKFYDVTGQIKEKQEILGDFGYQQDFSVEENFSDSHIEKLAEILETFCIEEKKKLPGLFDLYRGNYEKALGEIKKEEQKIRLFLQMEENSQIFLRGDHCVLHEEMTSSALKKLKEETAFVTPMKEMLKVVGDLLERRNKLLNSMAEFEELASDPKRLFKSSFQLNQEEKFRKTALPTLLKLEEELFKQIKLYDKDLIELKVYLDKEIEKRIINKSVFRIHKRK